MVDGDAIRVARRIATELMADGARAVVVTGSQARGDAHAHSDIDLHVVGNGPASTLRRRGGYLVSVEWSTLAAERACLRMPGRVGASVPAWRQAVILADPAGIAADLQRRAHAFRWQTIDPPCDAWVAGRITGFAEEVHKLAGCIGRRELLAAAAQRSVLALRLARVMSVQRRILYDTENVLWRLVAEAMGEEWRRAQSAALSIDGEPFEESCRAALELYALAASEAAPLLDRTQRAVVAHAATLRV